VSEKSFGRDNRRGEENLIVAVLEDESKCFQKYAFAHNQWEKRLFEGRIRKGGILLSVHCDNSEWTSKAKDILESTGANDVSSTSEVRADFAKSDKPMPRNHV
jgi:hypothetical protein